MISAQQHTLKMNESCLCMPLNQDELCAGVAAGSARMTHLFASRPVMFAGTPVFVSEQHQTQMQQLIRLIERLVRRRADVSAETPGLFMAYDFHITAQGPRLIEINTNAGGAFLVQRLYEQAAQTQSVCEGRWASAQAPQWINDMLLAEWHHSGRHGSPQNLVVVDDAPDQQFLAPEFELAREYFERAGMRTKIADPADLRWDGRSLTHHGEPIDLVYNRLTDFYLSDSKLDALRLAWREGATLVSPGPRHHALFADKRNLSWLSDPQESLRADLTADELRLLDLIPRVQMVSEADAQALWDARRELYFKPAHGFGSRGTYRGSKLTRGKWQSIVRSEVPYVAQQAVEPSVRRVGAAEQGALKYDLRAYSYDGEIKMLAARLYHGQTTNFRTTGGGFAPVVLVSAS